MTDTRLFGYIAFAAVLWLIYQQWTIDYGPAPSVVEQSTPTEVAPAKDLPETDIGLPTEQISSTAVVSANNNAATSISINSKRIDVITDVLALQIDLQGGNVVAAGLLAYPIDLEHPDQATEILISKGSKYYVAQSGLQTKGAPAPNHYANYQSSAETYELADNQDELRVPLTWSEGGVEVTKTFVLKRGAYDISVEHEVRNNSGEPWLGRQYRQLQRTYSDEGGQRFIYTYTGGVIYSPENKYEKIDFDEMAESPLSREFASGWAAMIQHYFLAAWVPNAEETNNYYSRGVEQGNELRYVLGLSGETVAVADQASHTFQSILYVGPKIQRDLKALATGLDLTVDYGFLTIIAKPLFKVLNFIYDKVGNWGWAIVIVTLLIKLVFYKLAESSYRSMANMRKLQPKMLAIKERYADDRQRQSQAMMELYKKEKINPLGGCLPMLIQIPVFIALYWVLLESVELRQADFILWIKDLSVKDPYFVLPVIMGISMYIQQKLSPAPVTDPVQAKVFMILPFVFTFFFMFFPSGLVLYWVVNNILTIAQQWVITKKVMAS